MRLRDLRWYILAAVVLLVSYAAVAFCFYLSIRSGKVENSMKELGLEVVESQNKIVNEKINYYYDLYIKDVSNELVYDYRASHDNTKVFERLGNHQQSLKSKFSGLDVAVVYEEAWTFEPTVVEEGVPVRDTNYYFYFGKQVTDTEYLVTRISATNFFSFIKDQIVVFNDEGIITFENVDGIQVGTSVASSDMFGTSYKNDINENGILSNVYSLAINRSAVSAIQNKTLKGYFTVIIDITDNYLGIAWVYQQAIIFYVIGILVVAGMLAIFILGCLKTSQLLRADRHALQKTEAIVLRIDVNGKIIFTNKTFKKIYGISREVDLNQFLNVADREPIMKVIRNNKAFICEVPLDDMRDEVRYFQLSPLYISRSYYLMGTDVTLDYNEAQDLRNLSGHNEVTGCENGFILSTRFQKIITSEYIGMDIAFVECNIHKHNDLISIFGRTQYNLALIEFLKILRNTFQDLEIYHMDDSKFMVVFPNSSIGEVTNKVNELLDTLRKPITIKQNNIYLEVKVVTYNLKQGTSLEDLVLESDDSEDMYRTKITLKDIETKLDLAYRNISDLSSKDYVVYEPAMDSIILASDEMDRDIESGLIEQEFQMWLQPQFDIVNNRIDGFEALIRWLNPKYRDKSPQIFIELAEKRGHMLDIGRFVITESFKLAKRLEPYGVHVSVNVSPVQLLQVGFVQQLIDEFNKNQLKTGAIAIEITETLLMGSFRLVAEKLKMLREAGFHIHLDDFCTGYSSMLYLKDLPVDTLKIDKEFTKYIETNKYNENIVKTICNLGNSLNLDLICEGVVTQEQSDMIKKMGCRVIQGWLIGKAMPYDQAVELLEKYNTNRK